MSSLLQRAEIAEAKRKNSHYAELHNKLKYFLEKCKIKDYYEPNYGDSIFVENGRPTYNASIYHVKFQVIEMDWGTEIVCFFKRLKSFTRTNWRGKIIKVENVFSTQAKVECLADLAWIIKAADEAHEWEYRDYCGYD